MKVDIWDVIKKFGTITGLVGALTGWYITHTNFKEYVNSTKGKNEKFEAFMASQTSINERSLVLYDLFINGRLPGTEGETTEGETAEARGPYREGYDHGDSERAADADGYYALETTEDPEGIGSVN